MKNSNDNLENNYNNIVNIGKNVFKSEADTVIKCAEILDDNFAKAAIILAKAERIVVTGIGKSGIIGQKIAATLASIGKHSYFMHSVDALHGDIGIIQKNDVVILLSKSGSTDEIIRLLPYIKTRSAFTIALVSDKDSYLAVNSDICLYLPVESEACPLNIVPTNSTTAALAMGDALSVAIMKINKISIFDFSMQHPLGQIGRNITIKVQDIMHCGNKIPVIFSGMKFKDALIEMTNKKLGCVCICNKHNKLKGIITDGDVRRILQKNDNITNLYADEVMTKSPTTISKDIFLGEALSIMSNRESQISVLPVIEDNGTLIGVIRVHDIVRSGI